MPLRTVLGLFVLLLPSLHAQSPEVQPGIRVRVQPPCDATDTGAPCEPVLGRLLRASGDSVLIEDAQGATRGIDLATASRFERSVGYRRHTLLGLGVGSLFGVGIGAMLVAGCGRGGSDDELCGIYFLPSAAAGAAVGTLVGALVRTERWEAVSGPATSLHVSPLPAAVSLDIHF
jgi:hypothetical protein